MVRPALEKASSGYPPWCYGRHTVYLRRQRFSIRLSPSVHARDLPPAIPTQQCPGCPTPDMKAEAGQLSPFASANGDSTTHSKAAMPRSQTQGSFEHHGYDTGWEIGEVHRPAPRLVAVHASATADFGRPSSPCSRMTVRAACEARKVPLANFSPLFFSLSATSEGGPWPLCWQESRERGKSVRRAEALACHQASANARCGQRRQEYQPLVTLNLRLPWASTLGG